MKAFAGSLILIGCVTASPANVKLGEEIGSLLSRGLSSDPAGFGAAYNAAMANFPMVGNDAVEAVAKNHMASSSFLGAPERDFSSCPVGWSSSGDLCLAPEGFYGCSRRFNKKVMNDVLKAKFAAKCGIEFPVSFARFWPEESEHPILNLHVKESASDASTNASVEASQRAQLAALESEQATTKEILADLLGKLNLRVEALAKKASAKQTSFLASRIISDVQREAENVAHLSAELGNIQARLADASYPAYNGLVHLLNLVSEPNAQPAMFVKFLGKPLGDLMKNANTPDSIKNLAGSILTQISSAPVTSQVSDTQGGAGQVNIVVPRPSRVYGPDAAVLALKAGADPADIA
jgi:CPW-WPC domain-containing protein